MNPDLAIIGKGAVSPAGIGVEVLFHGRPAPVMTAGLRHPEKTWPVLRVDLKAPELLRWQAEARLRRSSPLTLFLIEAAAQALAGISDADRAATGLIVAFSTGCLIYSRRFFGDILSRGQRMASPALFPETVFNSPGSHVASALRLNGAAYAQVGDDTAWVAAIRTASVWLKQERVRQVLVLAAEEFDPLALDAFVSARWLRAGAGRAAFIPSEGAGALLLRTAQPGDDQAITGARDGFIYRNRKEAAAAAGELFRGTDPCQPVYPTAQRTWLRALEKKSIAGRLVGGAEDLPYLGEASTASAAWNTIRALENLPAGARAPMLLPIWGLNHQLAMLCLKNRA
jgi:hypothetical protein